MKPEELNLTTDELDKLCHLYMDCKLSVLEEKELEYVLTQTELTSPSIDEVRSLMNIQLLPCSSKLPVRKRAWNWRYISGIAASLAVIISVAIYFLLPSGSNLSGAKQDVYIAAYSHGERLNGIDAIRAIDVAMAKADSLMHYAAMTKRQYMLKAENIITESFNY